MDVGVIHKHNCLTFGGDRGPLALVCMWPRVPTGQPGAERLRAVQEAP